MLYFSIAVFLILIFAVIYVFLVMPRVIDAADMDLQSTDYALCGLHSARAHENSLAAFSLAKSAGYGIALQVRLSADGKIFVFRDESLKRMCGTDQPISSLKSRDIRALRLAGGNEHIPLLSEVLSLVDGHVPILIEVKPSENSPKLCRRLAELMDGYAGAFAIQSLDPHVLGFFKKYRPRFARGQMLTRSSHPNFLVRFAHSHLFINVISRPDFISAEGCRMREPAFLLATRVFQVKGFVWTVRKQSQYAVCRKNSLYAIFENIRPQ